MKAEYVNSFYIATKHIFKLMLDLDAEMKEPKIIEGEVKSKDINVILGVTGDIKGNIIFSFPNQMGMEMVKIMSGMEMKTIDSFVSSALGEVANIIGGNAVTELSKYKCMCDIAPPQVLVGQYKTVPMMDEKTLCLPLRTEIGQLEIKMNLKGN